MRKNTKQKITTGALMLALTATILPVQNAEAASIRLNKKKLTLTKGCSSKLKVKGTSKKVTWKSSNKKVVSVSKKGKLKAKKAGTATITAKVKKKKLTCKITVTKPCNAPSATVKPSAPQKPSVTPKPSTPSATQKPSSSTGSVTETGAYATLNSLRNTYPEGMTLTNSYYYYSPRFGNGYGCYGFAAKLSDTIFGTQKAYTTHSSFDKIKVGDNIRIGNSHSVIVLTKNPNYITVVEGNYNSKVHWDRKITATSLASSGFKVCTRY